MEHQQLEVIADHKFEFMVCIAHEDMDPDNYGIFGPLSERQREILLSASNKQMPNIEVMRAWTIIHSDLQFISEVYPDSVGDIADHFIPSSQIQRMNKRDDIADHFIPSSQIQRMIKRDDWAKEPMLGYNSYMWDF